MAGTGKTWEKTYNKGESHFYVLFFRGCVKDREFRTYLLKSRMTVWRNEWSQLMKASLPISHQKLVKAIAWMTVAGWRTTAAVTKRNQQYIPNQQKKKKHRTQKRKKETMSSSALSTLTRSFSNLSTSSAAKWVVVQAAAKKAPSSTCVIHNQSRHLSHSVTANSSLSKLIDVHSSASASSFAIRQFSSEEKKTGNAVSCKKWMNHLSIRHSYIWCMNTVVTIKFT